MKSIRKPYNNEPGYVSSRVAELGGYVVIYDRDKGYVGKGKIPCRWVIVYTATGQHVSVTSLPHARMIQTAAAACTTQPELHKIFGVGGVR